MAGKTSNEWTNRTWKPIVGCAPVNPGCKNCYAMRLAHRRAANPSTPHYHGLTQKVNGKPVWTTCGRVDRQNLPVFPPIPGDLAEWREALGERPDLEPGIHRLADGVATRMDRTAAAGNGVVPLAAALAWRTLKERLSRADDG